MAVFYRTLWFLSLALILLNFVKHIVSQDEGCANDGESCRDGEPCCNPQSFCWTHEDSYHCGPYYLAESEPTGEGCANDGESCRDGSPCCNPQSFCWTHEDSYHCGPYY